MKREQKLVSEVSATRTERTTNFPSELHCISGFEVGEHILNAKRPEWSAVEEFGSQ
jgi:hypothetical protein